MPNGKAVFAQIMDIVPDYELEKYIDKYKRDYKTNKFTCRDQFMVMSYAQFTRGFSPIVSKDYPDKMRLVIYEDYTEGKNTVYRFLTNDFELPALTIAELYREGWQIVFFKWIKQHLHIQSFFRTTENTIYTQIWIAIYDYLLLIIAKKLYHIEQNLYIISQAIGLILFKRIPLSDILVNLIILN